MLRREIKEIERDIKELELRLTDKISELELRLTDKLTLRRGAMLAASVGVIATPIRIL